MKTHLSSRDFALTLAVVAVWGYTFVPIKVALEGTMIGFALVIGAAIAWAVGNIIAKRAAGEHGADVFALTVWSSLAPPLPLLALGYAFEGGRTRCAPSPR